MHRFSLYGCGAALTLTLAPFFWFPLLFACIPLLLKSIRQAPSAKRAFGCGWWVGFGYFTVGLYWFAHALLVDAAAFGWMIPFAVGGIGAILACYIGVTSCMTWYGRKLPITAFSLFFALCWTGWEIARSLLFSGFPWNLIGYSWAVHDIPMQAASLGGIWWVSLLTVTLGSLPLWWHSHKTMTISVMIAIGLLWTYGAWRLHQHPTTYHENIRLRLVQASIPQELKWNKEQRVHSIRRYMELSRAAGYETITHIIWPESAMTYRFIEGDYWSGELATLAPANGSLITGTVRIVAPETQDDPPYLYNSLQSITRDGEIDAIYDKRKLVPFGEFVPFRDILPLDKISPGALDYSAGGRQPIITPSHLPPYRPLICYESIFPWLSDNTHSGWLLNITNDGWFGRSTGPYQHLHMARIRAVEQGVPLIRSANSGVSAVIDPYGRILQTIALKEVGTIDSALPQSSPSQTFYGSYGYMLLMLTLCGYGGFIMLCLRR